MCSTFLLVIVAALTLCGAALRSEVERSGGLQAATASGRPVVLRIEAHGGHSLGSTRYQESALLADELAFLLHAFGLDDPDRGWPSHAAGWSCPSPTGR
jgi:hypothetical protein